MGRRISLDGERVGKLKFGLSDLVVAEQQHRLTHDRGNSALIFGW
jgi:hypothetical protein